MLEKRQYQLGRLFGMLPKLERLPLPLFRHIYRIVDKTIGLPVIRQVSIEEHIIKELQPAAKIRVYRPTGHAPSDTLVYFHGGGCVIGDLDSHDGICRYLCHFAQLNIVSVEYPLAPENPYPTPVIQSIRIWNWIIRHKDKLNLNGRLGAGGDSAGAYLTLTLSLTTEQDQLPVQVIAKPEYQFLLYPMVDLSAEDDSHLKHQKNLLLTSGLMDFFADQFINNQPIDRKTPLVSPLYSDNLSECPPTCLITCEYDPLCDGGIKFKDALEKLSIPLQYQHLEDCMHGFISVAGISSKAEQVSRQLCYTLKNWLFENH